MNKSDQINELATALAKAQGAIKGAAKDSANPFFKSKYADLASVWDACRQPLADNGLAVVQVIETDVGVVTVHTVLAHSSGQWISGVLALKPVKDDPQGMGSAATYARRYSLAAIVGVAPEDDDGNAASGNTGFTTRPPPPKQKKMDEDYRPPPTVTGTTLALPVPGKNTLSQQWKAFAQDLLTSARAAPTRDDLIEFQIANGAGMKALREASEPLHNWLAGEMSKISETLPPNPLAAG